MTRGKRQETRQEPRTRDLTANLSCARISQVGYFRGTQREKIAKRLRMEFLALSYRCMVF